MDYTSVKELLLTEIETWANQQPTGLVTIDQKQYTRQTLLEAIKTDQSDGQAFLRDVCKDAGIVLEL